MKRKLSVTVEDSTLAELDQAMKQLDFRNKSHFVESAINRMLRDVQNETKNTR